MKLWKKIKQINNKWFHIICILITIISLLYTIFYFKDASVRFVESLIDLWNSIICYINHIFHFKIPNNVTVNNFSKVEINLPFNLPSDLDEFKTVLSEYCKLLMKGSSIKSYLLFLLKTILNFSRFIIMFVPIVLLFKYLFRLELKKQNNNYNLDSKPLIKYKKLEDKIIYPTCDIVSFFFYLLNQYRIYKLIWIIIWAFNFNLVVICIEFLAYYMYFITSFNLLTIFIQVLKLIVDLFVIIDFVPGIFWFIVYLKIKDVIRKNKGYRNLYNFEYRNRDVIESRPVTNMNYGTMGSKKTLTLTDMAISTQIIHRNKAFELLLDCDLLFPNFPWINLENDLKTAMEHHKIFNLYTTEQFILKQLKQFHKNPCNENIWDYDYKKYGLESNNILYVEMLDEVLMDYAKLYFIYVIDTSFIISNYSIRTDDVLNDLGNLPLWNHDLFKKDKYYQQAYSRHAHILDFDMLRLGKKVLKGNKYKDIFEFGIICITEIGKERKNQVELQGVKRLEYETNQKNDLFNDCLKLVRHRLSTIRGYTFVKVLTDDQRPESLGADARELCDLICISSSSSLQLALPLFELEDLIIPGILYKLRQIYIKFRHIRGDNTLLKYLLHNIEAKIKAYYKKIYDTFGFYELTLNVEQAKGKDKLKDLSYYLMCKKDFSKRYSTDCFSDFFRDKISKSKKGIKDLPTYKTYKATWKEMQQQNSYLFNDLVKIKEDYN